MDTLVDKNLAKKKKLKKHQDDAWIGPFLSDVEKNRPICLYPTF